MTFYETPAQCEAARVEDMKRRVPSVTETELRRGMIERPDLTYYWLCWEHPVPIGGLTVGTMAEPKMSTVWASQVAGDGHPVAIRGEGPEEALRLR